MSRGAEVTVARREAELSKWERIKKELSHHERKLHAALLGQIEGEVRDKQLLLLEAMAREAGVEDSAVARDVAGVLTS